MFFKRRGASLCCTRNQLVQLLYCLSNGGEKDLGVEIDKQNWQTWTLRIHKGIVNVALVEARYKEYSKWYLVPEHLLKMYPVSSPLCFWKCGQVGTVLHGW